ncbi:MAG: pilus assembly protein PilM [Candidatus Eremiobacteraeota bacterium]|nr:pilus assembly protein PilM [Candidatus Eremiobacteraeota bacterium]
MSKSLPLGIDIGATRLRVVWSELTSAGPRVRAVVTRDLSAGVATSGLINDCAYIGALLDEARDELQSKERRCVLAVGEPEAVLRMVEFPKMTEIERQRAAVFEAQRYVAYAIDDAIVRIHPVDEKQNRYAIGVVRNATIKSRIAALKSGGLRVTAIDHEALALARALPGYDAILDIGHERTNVHISISGTPLTLQIIAGGATITRAIERELSIDTNSAEKRKRILGTVGAGESARSTFLADVTSLLESASLRTDQLKRIALVGNGARLNNFASDLERATGLLVETPVSKILLG